MAFSKIFEAREGEHRFLKLDASQCSADRPYDAILTGELNLSVSTYVVTDAESLEGDAPTSDIFWVYLVDIRPILSCRLLMQQGCARQILSKNFWPSHANKRGEANG